MTAVEILNNGKANFCLMHCVSSYPCGDDRINLPRLKWLQELCPVIGLSDHTSSTVIPAISIGLGVTVIEKHFTDSNKRNGPDHKFSMNPKTWREMIVASRTLEMALGKSIKKVEMNEQETIILQRRSIRAKKDIKKNQLITKKNFEFLRPCPKDAMPVYNFYKILNKKSKSFIKKGDYIKK